MLVVRSTNLALFVFVALTSLVRGQSTHASLTGRVADPSKALAAD
jgi:hypothetical protein